MTAGTVELKMLGDMKGEIGELRGKVGEINHNVNNMATKLDALYLHMSPLNSLPAEVAKQENRITKLEAQNLKEAGAKGVLGWVFQAPLLGWLATAAVIAWAFIKDKAG